MKRKITTMILAFVIVFSAFVPCSFAAANEISKVNITLPVPHVGAEIYDHDEIILDNDKCRVGLIGWFSEFGGVGNIPQSDVFLPGHDYSLYITIERNSENYVFAEDCVVTVNGEPIEVERAESGRYVHFVYDFEKSADDIDNPFSFFEIIEGYIKEFFGKIYKIFASFFGYTIY